MGQHANATAEVLAGLVERVTFHNPENGFCVLRLKARGHRDLVTTVGHAAMISAGEWVTASGEWTNDRTHGQQFRARFLKTSAPSSIEGIERYLGSGMMPRHRPGLCQAHGQAGDKVMQIENDYDKEVYNGDIGYVEGVDLDDGELTASFDGRSVTYGFGELDALVPRCR
jgi:exodeoxyribonuclease V alpha subunit